MAARRDDRRGSTPEEVKILFVDDDQLICELARRTAIEIGYPMHIVGSAEEALEACEANQFALVLLDLNLPGLSGEALLGHIKERSPATDIIILTAYPSLRSAIRTFRDGAHDYLLKPIEAIDLRHTIERCLQTQHLRRQLVTETRLRRQIEELSRLKSEFLANLSHEFRTPLHHILGYIELVLEDDTENQGHRRRDLGKAHHSARHLLAMIERMLLMTQIDTCAIHVEWQHVDLESLLRSLAARFAQSIRDKGLSFVADVEAGLGLINAGPKLLEQAFSEILDNARKFTERGEVRLVARRQVSGDGTAWARVDVTDSGPGIPPDSADAIFDEFRQLDGTSVRAHGGTGLGLALSRKLLELFGGTITAPAAPGSGSTFRVDLPLWTDSAADPPGHAGPEAAP